MELKLIRVRKRSDKTNGQLYVNGELLCFTLEDTDRQVEGESVEKWKIKGQTCIPRGVYKVTLERSQRFGENCPTIHDVPGFDFIRMHAGNTQLDTEGCPLVGYDLDPRTGNIMAGSSRPAYIDLQTKLKKATYNEEDIFISVEDL